MAAPDEWRWTDDQGVQRVVRTDELRSALASSVLAPSTLVWREGMAGWVPAFTVPELGAIDSPASISDASTEGNTDVGPPPREAAWDDAATGVTDGEPAPPAPAPRIEPPALVVAKKVPATPPDTGSARDTGRPTPTELLNEGGGKRGEGSSNGSSAPRPAAGQPAGDAGLKIGAAPRPLPSAARPTGKVESSTSTGIGKSPLGRPGAAGWRKPEAGKLSEDVTLVADAADPFKLRAHGESPSNGTSGAVAGGAAGKDSRVAMSLASRRPVTKTALLTPEQQAPKPLPAAGRPPSTMPPAPAAVRRLATGVPPPPVQVAPRRSSPSQEGARPASEAPAAGSANPQDPKGFRTTAFMGSGNRGSSRPAPGPAGGGSVAVPAPPRIPKLEKPNFSIVENTSTDSTGVLPLGGSYAAEPTVDTAPAERALARPERGPIPSYVDGAPAFAERTPSFPDAAVPGAPAPSAGANGYPDPRPPLRSRPPALETQPPPQPQVAISALHGSYPPAPVPGNMQLLIEGAPYSAPPPPLALGEPGPGYGELRTTGALPLVHPKRAQAEAAAAAAAAAPAPADYSSVRPPPSLSNPPPPDPGAPDAATQQMPSRVGDPVVVPLSSLFLAGATLIGMAIAAFFMGRCSVAPGPSSAPARAVLAPLPRLARAALPSPPKPCWMAKQPVRWAPSVVQSVPVDVAPSAKGVVVAYARDAREPATVEVDFASGALDDKPADKRDGDLVRVFAPRDGSPLLVTTKADAGPLAPYVFAPGKDPFVIGVAGKGTPSPTVSAADKPDGAPVTLWTLPAIDDDKGLEAARVLATGPSGHAVVFRRSGSILGGFLGEGRKAEGGLGVVAGSGGSVGKPSIGSNRTEIAVVFGDKSGADAPWEIRVGHAPLGQMPRESMVVPLPKGGPGGDAFAPDVAGTADGRWVLVWTEGKSGAYAVRAQTFGADWKPLGDPIAISPPAGNFGQAVVGVAGEYVTTMFLSRASSGSYELWGAVLQCGS